ncbi:MAG: hypothetical protein WC343_09340 [Bacilli bacterium]|jgi:hypothetical protein
MICMSEMDSREDQRAYEDLRTGRGEHQPDGERHQLADLGAPV